MNWVNSSLQLAGSLLESVDQKAALTLSVKYALWRAGEDDEHDEGLLSSITKGINVVKSASATSPTSVHGASDDELSYEADEALDVQDEASESAVQGGDGVDGTDVDEAADTPEGDVAGGEPAALAPAVEGTKPLEVKTAPPRKEVRAPLPSPAARTPPASGTAPRKSVVASPPLSSGGGSKGSATSADTADTARWKKENARLRSDVKAKEKLLANVQRQLKICEEEIVALENECKDRIAEVQKELAMVREEKDADERNFVQALEVKDQQVTSLKTDMAALQTRAQSQESEIASLKAQVAEVIESKENLWSNAASASNESEQLITSLRTELQETLTAMNNIKREYAESKMTVFTRQSQLETTNAELMNNVANLERELAKMKEAAAASGGAAPGTPNGASSQAFGFNGVSSSSGSGANATWTDDYRKLQQTLVITKKSLHDETRKSEIQRQEIITLNEEVKRLKDVLETTQIASTRHLLAAQKETEELKEKLKQLDTRGADTSSAESDARIQTLTNRLLEKQESIDALRSKLTTMDVRLVDAQNRARNAEEKLAHIERNGGIDDMEMATPIGKRNGGSGMRSRNRMSNAISRVAPVVERSARVVSALDVFDRWLMFLGRIFLSYPFARLAMVCYFALIHFWVFVVLSFHTSHLNEEVEQQQHAPGVNGYGNGIIPEGPGVLHPGA
ncbi:TPA: hypothetical protein N0F65_006200 [Lagenidium giganteum]|uniref:Golgin-84 n=1 Tax=Lagenidium giganteum TaxID=4803 RepID=A0AAV2Z8U2_9STRA|nr:TPA: hypothetical protein N0F65_006200 [Lagenidium giganteum]